MTEPITTGASFVCHFRKLGPIRFISHLDLSRAFHRAFLRAGLPLKFSEGFSPHPKFSLALPLSVGTESEAEFAFFTLKDPTIPCDEILARLKGQLPEGVIPVSVKETSEKGSVIAFASYRILLPRAGKDEEAVRDLFSRPVTVTKKNKKGKPVEKELTAGIRSLSVTRESEGLVIETVLCADGENFLKPELLLSAAETHLSGIDLGGARIRRLDALRGDMTSLTKENN